MKHLSILLTFFMAVAFVSCDDSDDNTLTTTTSVYQIYTVTAADGSTLTFPASNFVYEVDYNEGEIDITLNNVKFSPRMPEITMEINDIPFTYTESGIKMNATNLIPEVGDEPMPNYTISTFSGRIATSELTESSKCKISFVVGGGFTVTAYPTPLVYEFESNTIVNNTAINSVDQFTSDDSSYVLKLDAANSTADLYIYDAKFAERMPAMNMVFKNIPFTANNSGFTMSSEALTPSIIGSTGSETPAPNYTISNLSINVDGDRLATNFTCTITDQNNSAIGEYIVSAAANMFPSETIQK